MTATRDRLASELRKVAAKANPGNAAKYEALAKRAETGEFDASAEESEEWARSQTDPDTIRVMDALGIGPNRKGDH